MAPKVRPIAPFLEKLTTATSKKECGIYQFEGFLSPEEAQEAFDDLVGDATFPWDTQPELNGEPLTNQSCEQDLLESAKEQKKKNGSIKYNSSLRGLLKLGELFARIEDAFDIKINYVCCNRFPSPNNEWQKNSYGERFCVLTLGSERRIEIRNNKTQHTETMTSGAGDLYVMPMKLNGNTHTHRICPTTDKSDDYELDAGALLSLVFFFEAPTYAKEIEKAKKPKLLGRIANRTKLNKGGEIKTNS